MSSIIRSISLDTKTAAIAKRVPNFSKFVRQCLLQWDAIRHRPDCPVERLGHGLVGDHCVPSPTRVCLKHWPHGRPRREDWKEFRNMIEFDSYHQDRDRLLQAWPFLSEFDGPEEWIQFRAEMVNEPPIDFAEVEIEGNAKPKKKTPKSPNPIRQLARFLGFK